jgi:hypothetical protein
VPQPNQYKTTWLGQKKCVPPNQTGLKNQPKTKTQTQNKPELGKSTANPNLAKNKKTTFLIYCQKKGRVIVESNRTFFEQLAVFCTTRPKTKPYAEPKKQVEQQTPKR